MFSLHHETTQIKVNSVHVILKYAIFLFLLWESLAIVKSFLFVSPAFAGNRPINHWMVSDLFKANCSITIQLRSIAAEIPIIVANVNSLLTNSVCFISWLPVNYNSQIISVDNSWIENLPMPLKQLHTSNLRI